jgi:putative hydrolase of the HAD superfamily
VSRGPGGPVRAVLFDLDDTLIDHSGAVEACWDAACARAGAAGVDPALLARTVRDVRAWFWSDPVRHARERVATLDAWTKIAAAALERLRSPSILLARALATDFAARRMATTALFDDARPCLQALRARGLPLGLVTNGDAVMQREKLARFALEPYFDVVVIEGELGVGKPDAAVYRHALDTLGVPAESTLMIGDNFAWDVAGANAVGITGVHLDRHGHGAPSSPPDVPVIRTLHDVPA